MGQGESRGQNPEAENAEVAGVPDYYALLEVDESASADEIKVCLWVFDESLKLTRSRICRNRSEDLL